MDDRGKKKDIEVLAYERRQSACVMESDYHRSVILFCQASRGHFPMDSSCDRMKTLKQSFSRRYHDDNVSQGRHRDNWPKSF